MDEISTTIYGTISQQLFFITMIRTDFLIIKGSSVYTMGVPLLTISDRKLTETKFLMRITLSSLYWTIL